MIEPKNRQQKPQQILIEHHCGSIFSLDASVLQIYRSGKVIRCPFCFKVIPGSEIKQLARESVRSS